MSEKAPIRHEHEKAHEADSKQHEKLQETIEAGKKAEHASKDTLEKIRSSIDKEAVKSAEKKREHQEEDRDGKGTRHTIVDRNLKQKAYSKELHRVQGRLPKSQRAFSKVVHNRAVEAVSEVGGKTVARPSGLLGGGIVAFVGTLVVVLVSRHYGFEYNFFVFIALLVGGFFLGLILEVVIRGFMKSRS